MPPSVLSKRATAASTNERFASAFTLARWRLRQTGWLLLTVCLGFVAAMIIACVVPLFTAVANVSSLQTMIQANPAYSNITLSVNTQGLSSGVFNAVQQQILPLVQPRLGPYQQGSASLAIQEGGIQGLAPASIQHVGYFSIYAAPLNSLKPSLRLVSGRWPASGAHDLEVALTPEAARALHLSLGAEMTLQGDFSASNQSDDTIDPRTALTAQLVGLFEVNLPVPLALHGQTFLPAPSGASSSYTIFTDSTSLLQAIDQIASRLHVSSIISFLGFQMSWDYLLHTKNIGPDQVPDLTNRLFTIQTNVSNYGSNQQRQVPGSTASSTITQANLYSPAPGTFALLDILQQYTNRVALVSIPVTVLAMQIIALLLFFVSILVNMLLDRQVAANAMLSSRGASSRQIFWSLFFQGLALCLLGIVLGPLVGLAFVSVLVERVLPAGNVHLAQSILTQPLAVLSSIGPTAGGTLLVALLTIGLIIRYTSGLNILTLRRETARVTRLPFWQRYYLDVLAAVIALSAYGVSLYLAGIAREVDITTQDLILAPLALVAPIFLLLGCLLIFMRIFPWLLRLGGWIAHRRRGATSMLALVQMARAPRQIMRMTLLLSLTVAFAIFAQVFSASQTQHISDVSAYEAGADFSGDIASQPAVQNLSLNQVIDRYRQLPGVIAASADYTAGGTVVDSSGGTTTIQFRGVDPGSFLQTVIWPAQDSAQELPALFQRLSAPKVASLPDGTRGQVVPVLVDQALASQLQVQAGGIFAASLDGLTQATLHYQVVAVVAHIPTVNSSTRASASQSPGGMIATYQALLTTYTKVLQQQQAATARNSAQQFQSPVLPANHIWLRTRDTSAALASLRSILAAPGSKLALNNLYDRREIAAELQSDPFNLNILIILGIGALTAFLLAFIGNLVSSWLSVRGRRGSFVVLRALGATSRHIAGILLWEQGIVYLGALVLGLAFGMVLTSVAVPVLVFTGLPTHGPMSSLGISDLYLLQQALPARVVVPFSLDLIFVALVLICLLALALMVRAALHPSISDELRLNED